MAYQRDILDELADANRAPRYPEVEVELGMVVEDRASGYCGDIVRWTSEAVTLRDRHQHQRHFGWKDGGFRLDGRPVTLRRPAARRDDAVATRRLTASGSVAGPSTSPRVAAASRIWVEGRHDAELLELVWGDDLRDAAIVVEPMHGIDGLAAAVQAFAPAPRRRLGILVDHLVPGSKEQRLAATVAGPDVLVTGHPFVDVWAGIRPSVHRDRRLAGRAIGHTVERGRLSRHRHRPRRLLGQAAQPRGVLRRPASRARRRRRSAHRLRRLTGAALAFLSWHRS